MTAVETANLILSLLTLISQIAIILLIASIFLWKYKKQNPLFIFAGKQAIKIAFLVALFSVVVSLFYSEIAGYSPCKLCWFQRTLMYPQVIILGLALWKKDKNAADYIIALSLIGVIIAAYQYYLQASGAPSIICSAGSYLISCSQKLFSEFGYITLPMMSLTAFLLNATLLSVKKFFES